MLHAGEQHVVLVAGAEHITFGDADFLADPARAVQIVERLRDRRPCATYDVTIPVPRLLAHPDTLLHLAATGCLFVTTEVVSVDDAVLTRLRKGHTRADVVAAAGHCRRAGLGLSPTLVPFHPWTTRRSLLDMFLLLADLGLADAVAPTQFTKRLEVPGAGSPRDPDIDPDIEALHARFEAFVALGRSLQLTRGETFDCLYALAGGVKLRPSN